MKISLQNLLPNPLKDYSLQKNSLWNNNYDIESGENILINAASGKGKTTLTHILAGLRKDYDGNLIYDGKNTMDFDISHWIQLRQKKISFVFQDLQLLPTLTFEENILVSTSLKGGKSVDKIKEWAAVLGLKDKWSNKVGILSMGQQQRVAILRALSQPFETLVLDEPFSHLDEHNATLAMELILTRCEEQNAGFILTTLDPTEKYKIDQVINL